MSFIGTDVQAEKMNYNFNIILPDVNEKVALIVQNGVVTPRIGSLVNKDVTTTITINRADLDNIILGQATYESLIHNDTIKIEGDKKSFIKFLSKLDKFDSSFNIVEP